MNHRTKRRVKRETKLGAAHIYTNSKSRAGTENHSDLISQYPCILIQTLFRNMHTEITVNSLPEKLKGPRNSTSAATRGNEGRRINVELRPSRPITEYVAQDPRQHRNM